MYYLKCMFMNVTALPAAIAIENISGSVYLGNMA